MADGTNPGATAAPDTWDVTHVGGQPVPQPSGDNTWDVTHVGGQPVTQPAPQRAENSYRMMGPQGETSIPFSGVEQAKQQGMRFSGEERFNPWWLLPGSQLGQKRMISDEEGRYQRDQLDEQSRRISSDPETQQLMRQSGVVGLEMGAAREAARTGVGIHDLAAGKPKAGEKKSALRQFSEEENKGFDETLGAGLESTGEFISGGELLGLVGKYAKGAEALKGATQIMQTIDQYPVIGRFLRIGIDAAKTGAGMGAQEYVKSGGDTERTKNAAEMGAAFGGATRTALEGGATVGRYLMRNAPQTIERLGQSFDVLPSQLTDRGGVVQGNIADFAPKVYESQQAALPGAVRNLAQRAVRSAVDLINAGRPAVPQAIEDTARMLPMPEGAAAEPFTFSVGTTPATEETTGAITQPAEKGVRLPGGRQTYTANVEPTPVEGPRERIASYGTTGADISTQEVRPKVTPEARGETVGGGPARATNNPHEALRWQTQLENLQRSPEFAKLPQEQQDAVNQAVKDLNEQLGMYYRSPYAQRFGPEGVDNLVDQTGDFAEGAAQLEHAAKPVYAAIDEASNGDFTKWNNQYKQARDTLANAAQNGMTIDAQDAAMDRMTDAERKIMGVIDNHHGAISFDDYQAARNTWRRAARMGELHAMLENMMNGVDPQDVTEHGMERLMSRGRVEQFKKYLDTGTNRQQIQELIGSDGTAHLKEFLNMFSNAQNNRAMQRVARTMAGFMYGKRAISDVAGAGLGTGVAAALGLPVQFGAGAGLAGTEAVRWILRKAATEPAVGKMLMYAAEHNIDPRIYTPLIARAISVPFEEQKKPKKPEEQGQEEPAPAAAGAAQ